MAKKVDTMNFDPMYWEKILKQLGFSMERGGIGDVRHSNAVLEYLENKQDILEDVQRGNSRSQGSEEDKLIEQLNE